MVSHMVEHSKTIAQDHFINYKSGFLEEEEMSDVFCTGLYIQPMTPGLTVLEMQISKLSSACVDMLEKTQI